MVKPSRSAGQTPYNLLFHPRRWPADRSCHWGPPGDRTLHFSSRLGNPQDSCGGQVTRFRARHSPRKGALPSTSPLGTLSRRHRLLVATVRMSPSAALGLRVTHGSSFPEVWQSRDRELRWAVKLSLTADGAPRPSTRRGSEDRGALLSRCCPRGTQQAEPASAVPLVQREGGRPLQL